MARYEKWLGAGLGWMVGGPIGGILGFITGSMIEKGQGTDAKHITTDLTEFEINLIVLASYMIKLDGRVSMREIEFTENFLNTHFDKANAAQRKQVLHHCLQKEYDLGVVCDQMRMNTSHSTRIQVVRFLFDLALCDGDLNQREDYFIFKLAGFLNVNDVEFGRIKTEHTQPAPPTYYEILEVHTTATADEIRSSYRRLVLKYHPDRNKNATEEEKKKLAARFQQIQEAYDILKEKHK